MKQPKIIWVLVILTLLFSGCSLFVSDTVPQAVFIAPPAGSSYSPGDDIRMVVSASDLDGPGIVRVEVYINGILYNTGFSPSGNDPVFNYSLTWRAETPGNVSLMAIAYRQDGTVSAPATMQVIVSGGQAAAPAAQITPPSEPAVGWVQGRITTSANIRSGPGILCESIGNAETGTDLNLMEFSADQIWLMTDVLGPGQIGWVWVDLLRITGDQSLIPIGPETGCLGCGDGFCSADEGCDICVPDCGSCVDIDVCGDGVCSYAENCQTCVSDCGPCEIGEACGDGLCADGEDCNNCPQDCSCAPFSPMIDPGR